MQSKTNLLTAHQLAQELTLSVETIWRYTREKRIPYTELGPRQYRYDLNQVMKALHPSDNTAAESAADYTAKKRFTYQDYVQLPEQPGMRFEVLDGCLVKDPSPVIKHQRCSACLQGFLADYFRQRDPKGAMLYAPLDVILSEYTVVQPDLLYIPGSAAEVFAHPYVDIPPELVVEILSPSTTLKDRIHKTEIYRQAGVPHYWIVDPDAETVEAFALKDSHYALVAVAAGSDVFQHPDFPDLEIPLEQVFVKTR